jgi:hypothetical protein
MNVTRLLLFQNNVSKTYWSDAVLTSTYLINRLPSARLRNMGPLEIFKGRKIDLDHIRVFGCTCFVHIKQNDKFDKNSDSLSQPTVLQPHNFIYPEEISQEQMDEDHTHESSAIPLRGDGEESQEEAQEEIAPDTDE